MICETRQRTWPYRERIRLQVIKRDGEWRLYDFETSLGVRLSHLFYTGGDRTSARGLQAMLRALERFREEDWKGASRHVNLALETAQSQLAPYRTIVAGHSASD